MHSFGKGLSRKAVIFPWEKRKDPTHTGSRSRGSPSAFSLVLMRIWGNFEMPYAVILIFSIVNSCRRYSPHLCTLIEIGVLDLSQMASVPLGDDTHSRNTPCQIFIPSHHLDDRGTYIDSDRNTSHSLFLPLIKSLHTEKAKAEGIPQSSLYLNSFQFRIHPILQYF